MAFTYTGEMVDLGFGRGWLNRPAASSILRIDRQLGHALQITEAGRTWGKQNEHYQTYLRVGYPIALAPDTPSVHQKGGAIDSNEAQRIIAILEDHGWRRTVYRWVGGKWTLVEPWHFEYFQHLDNHRNEPASGGVTPFPEDDMFTDEDRKDLEAIRSALLDGIPGRDLSTGRLDQIANAAFDVSDRFYVKKVDGSKAYDLTQLTVNEIKPLLLAILGRVGGTTVDVDEEALAAELATALAPYLAQNVGTLSDDSIAALAKAAADEQDRRARERLEK